MHIGIPLQLIIIAAVRANAAVRENGVEMISAQASCFTDEAS